MLQRPAIEGLSPDGQFGLAERDHGRVRAAPPAEAPLGILRCPQPSFRLAVEAEHGGVKSGRSHEHAIAIDVRRRMPWPADGIAPDFLTNSRARIRCRTGVRGPAAHGRSVASQPRRRRQALADHCGQWFVLLDFGQLLQRLLAKRLRRLPLLTRAGERRHRLDHCRQVAARVQRVPVAGLEALGEGIAAMRR